MSNGGIIGPVNDPTRGPVTTSFTSSGTYTSPGFGPGSASVLVVAYAKANGQSETGEVTFYRSLIKLIERDQIKKLNTSFDQTLS